MAIENENKLYFTEESVEALVSGAKQYTDETMVSYSISKENTTITLTGSDGNVTTVEETVTTVSDDGLGNVTLETAIGITGGGGRDIIVDTTLSTGSTNPVQNRVITTEINKVKDDIANIIQISDVEPTDENTEIWINMSEESGDGDVSNATKIDVITPQQFGAMADGVTDDTAAINAAIESLTDGSTLYFPDGTYLVSETDTTVDNDRIAIRVDGKQNITLLLSDYATIKHAPSTNAYYRTIRLNECSGVTIRGGNLVGEYNTHTPEYKDDGTIQNTHGYGIRCIECSGITIEDVDISNYYGDPIVLCSEVTPYQGCQNVRILNCRIHDSARNGITVTSCQGLLVKDCEIYNITGAMPMAGIDIEGEYKDAENCDITIEGCNIHDNGNSSIVCAVICDNIHVRNCKLTENFTMSDSSTGVVLSGCEIGSVTLRSDAVVTDSVISEMALSGSEEVTVSGCKFIPATDSQHNLSVERDGSIGRFIGCEFLATSNQDMTFYNVRGTKQHKALYFTSCVFHTECVNVDFPILLKGETEFIGCTFVNKNTSWGKQWMRFAGTKTTVVGCVFDASALTSYNTNWVGLVRIAADSAIIQNCIIKTAESVVPARYAFNCADVTGDLYLIGNTVPSWDVVGNLPTGANKVVSYNNVLSGTTGESEIDVDSIVNAVLEALPEAEGGTY